MSFLAYLQIFSSYWSSTLQFFFPGIITYKQFAFILAIISAAAILKTIINNKLKIARKSLAVIIIIGTIVILYSITPFFYSLSTNTNYDSFFLALVGQLAPGIITATLLSNNYLVQEKIKALTPIVSIVFTFITFVGALFPTSSTSGGYVDNENGLNYQLISYIAAYSSALIEYYLLVKDNIIQIKIFKSRKAVILLYFIIFIDLFIILMAGGRGGFLAYFLFIILTIFIYLFTKKIRYIQLGKFFLGGVVASGVLVFVINRINFFNMNSGISRILGFLSGEGDPARASLRDEAISIFLNKPIVGHGLGSVFYELGIYSHNFFTDSLVEMGIIGTFLISLVILKALIKCKKMIKIDYTNCIWLYIFLCGFIMSMFSGYYLNQFPLWWSVVFMLSFRPKKASEVTADIELGK